MTGDQDVPLADRDARTQVGGRVVPHADARGVYAVRPAVCVEYEYPVCPILMVVEELLKPPIRRPVPDETETPGCCRYRFRCRRQEHFRQFQ